MRLELVLKSSFDQLERAVEEAETFVRSLESDEDFIYNVVLLVSEAVTNAIEHGNQLDETKTVTMVLEATDREVTLTVQDEGAGFSPQAVADPLAVDNLLEARGRGVYMMQEMADRLEYEDRGRRIILGFNRPAAS